MDLHRSDLAPTNCRARCGRSHLAVRNLCVISEGNMFELNGTCDWSQLNSVGLFLNDGVGIRIARTLSLQRRPEQSDLSWSQIFDWLKKTAKVGEEAVSAPTVIVSCQNEPRAPPQYNCGTAATLTVTIGDSRTLFVLLSMRR